MEFNCRYFGSFVVICVVSAFCVSIGIGGGILYVPILGFLYTNIQQGVYLSKISIMVTSLIGVSYHLFNDVSNWIKILKDKKSSTQDGELGPKYNIWSEYDKSPRIYFVLSMSFVPWCILGSNVGTISHFLAKDYLKPVMTSIVSLCFLVTSLKLYFIYRNKKLKLSSFEDSFKSRSQVIDESDRMNEMGSKDQVSNKSIMYRIFRPYIGPEAHSLRRRLISSIILPVCLALYYITARFEYLYVEVPLKILIAVIGVFYSIKARLTYRGLNYYSTTYGTKLEGGELQKNTLNKVLKFLDTGVHFILLNTFIAFISGFFSGIIGIGSGLFMVPLLQYLNLSPISCTATANLLTLVMSLATLSRFSVRISLTAGVVIPVVAGSFLGTSLSLFVIRSLTKDKITSLFVNVTLLLFCISSIVVTWVI